MPSRRVLFVSTTVYLFILCLIHSTANAVGLSKIEHHSYVKRWYSSRLVESKATNHLFGRFTTNICFPDDVRLNTHMRIDTEVSDLAAAELKVASGEENNNIGAFKDEPIGFVDFSKPIHMTFHQFRPYFRTFRWKMRKRSMRVMLERVDNTKTAGKERGDVLVEISDDQAHDLCTSVSHLDNNCISQQFFRNLNQGRPLSLRSIVHAGSFVVAAQVVRHNDVSVIADRSVFNLKMAGNAGRVYSYFLQIHLAKPRREGLYRYRVEHRKLRFYDWFGSSRRHVWYSDVFWGLKEMPSGQNVSVVLPTEAAEDQPSVEHVSDETGVVAPPEEVTALSERVDLSTKENSEGIVRSFPLTDLTSEGTESEES